MPNLFSHFCVHVFLKHIPVQNCYRDLAEIGEISISSRLMRSRRDCRDLAEISPWCLLDSKFRRDRGEISSISPRLPRTRQDCRDRTEIVEISPWRLWHSKSQRDRGEISSISPRLPRSRRDLKRPHHNVWKTNKCHGEISAISPWYLLVSQISSSLRQDFLHLAKIGEISPWNSTLSVSCQDFERHKLLTEIAII